MCWKLCWFNYRPTFGASINALLLATRAHTALTKTNWLQSILKQYEINHVLTQHGQLQAMRWSGQPHQLVICLIAVVLSIFQIFGETINALLLYPNTANFWFSNILQLLSQVDCSVSLCRASQATGNEQSQCDQRLLRNNRFYLYTYHVIQRGT